MRIPFTRERRNFLFEVTKPVTYGHDTKANLSGKNIQRLALSAFGIRWTELIESFGEPPKPATPPELARAAYPGAAAHAMTFVYLDEIRQAATTLDGRHRRQSDTKAYSKIARDLTAFNKHEFSRTREIGAYTMSQLVSHVDGKYDAIRLECNTRRSDPEEVAGLREERKAYLETIGRSVGSSEYAAWALETFGEDPSLPLARIPNSLSQAVERTDVITDLAHQEDTKIAAGSTLSDWLIKIVHRDLLESGDHRLHQPVIAPLLEFKDGPV